MNKRFMKVKKLVLPMITVILMVSQMAGCAKVTQDEMIDLTGQGQQVEIDVPDIDEEGNEDQEENQGEQKENQGEQEGNWLDEASPEDILEGEWNPTEEEEGKQEKEKELTEIEKETARIHKEYVESMYETIVYGRVDDVAAGIQTLEEAEQTISDNCAYALEDHDGYGALLEEEDLEGFPQWRQDSGFNKELAEASRIAKENQKKNQQVADNKGNETNKNSQGQNQNNQGQNQNTNQNQNVASNKTETKKKSKADNANSTKPKKTQEQQAKSDETKNNEKSTFKYGDSFATEEGQPESTGTALDDATFEEWYGDDVDIDGPIKTGEFIMSYTDLHDGTYLGSDGHIYKESGNEMIDTGKIYGEE